MALRNGRLAKRRRHDMKLRAQKIVAADTWWDDVLEYERTHEIAFASPTALVDARIIAELEKKCGALRRALRKGSARRRKTGAT